MTKKTKTIVLTLVVMTLGFLYWLPVEWTRRTISVRVVDSRTEEPIEGAIVFVDWFRIAGPIGLTHSTDLEDKEGLTDSQGYLKIPKYSFANFHMAAYKQGYVCWSNRGVFPPGKPRQRFWIRDGATVKLERFLEGYSRAEHADFMDAMTTGNYGGRLFDQAVRAEKKMATGETGRN